MVNINGIVVYETLPAHCVDIHDACVRTLASCIEDAELGVPNAVDSVTRAGVIEVGGARVHWGLVDEQADADTVIVDAPLVTEDIIAALLTAGLIHVE